jgi:hypothetical protein
MAGQFLIKSREGTIYYFRRRPEAAQHVIGRRILVQSLQTSDRRSALVRHGFIDFLRTQQLAGFQRPFKKEWKPREVKSELGQIIKWSHYVSRWGGRELDAVAVSGGFDAKPLAYFHSMRHTFKRVLGDAGVSSEISEALSGRRYAGADVERYEKLKQNNVDWLPMESKLAWIHLSYRLKNR